MKNLCAAVTAASLAVASLTSAGLAAPLAPGKPAGLTQAQERDNTVIYIVGLGIVAAGIALVASGNSNGNLAPGTLTGTTTTTTTTTKAATTST